MRKEISKKIVRLFGCGIARAVWQPVPKYYKSSKVKLSVTFRGGFEVTGYNRTTCKESRAQNGVGKNVQF